MRQFLAWFTFVSGEYSAPIPAVFKARDLKSAENKAIKWMRNYFLGVSRWDRKRLKEKGDSRETVGYSFFDGGVRVWLNKIEEASDAGVVAALSESE